MKSKWNFVLIALVLIAIIVLYEPAIHFNNLFWDDYEYFHSNRLVKNPGLDSFKTFFSEVLEPSTVAGYYQPVTMVSFMLDYWMGARTHDTRIIRLHNLLLHLFNVLLLMYFLYLLFSHVKAAVITGLIFGIHPSSVDAIAWISERKTLLATFYCLICMISYIKYLRSREIGLSTTGKKRYLYLSELFYVLAFLSKPIIAMLPFLLLLLDIYPLKVFRIKSLVEKWRFFIIFFVLSLVTIYSQTFTSRTIQITEKGLAYSIYITSYRLKYYVLKYLLPVNISPYNPAPDFLSLKNPEIMLALVLCGILPIILILGIKYNRIIFTGLLFYLLALIPSAGIFQASKLVVNYRYIYFPSIGLMIVLCWYIIYLLNKANGLGIKTRLLQVSKFFTPSLLFISLYTLFLLFCTKGYLDTWRNNHFLALNMYRINPNDNYTQLYYGRVLLEEGKYDECEKICKSVIALPAAEEIIKRCAYKLLFEKSLLEKDLTGAKSYLTKAGNALSLYQYGIINRYFGNSEAAYRYFKDGYTINNRNMDCLSGLSKMLTWEGKVDEGLTLAQGGLAIDPGNENLQMAMAFGKFAAGDLIGAKAWISKALNTNQNNPEPYYLLSKIAKQENHTEEERTYLQKAIERDKLGMGTNMPDSFFE